MESIFVRVAFERRADQPASLRTYLVEIEPGGEITREIGYDADGRPDLITRRGDYPIFDWPAPPGSPLFKEQFGDCERISAEEFERAYGEADALLEE